MRTGFVFDMNRCVGCQACVIACQIENHAIQSEPWRTINTFNTFQHPLLPLFHFSLACNHCEIPLCLEHCPSRAYTKDLLLRTIDHDADRCIGCRYCVWACPYDAPKFIHARGVVEKCTLCKPRIEEGLKPNCASLCPTGALDFGEIDGEPVGRIPGFVDKGIRPGIKIIPLRKSGFHHPVPVVDEDGLTNKITQLGWSNRSKVTLKQEWPLVVFTILVSILFAALAASIVKPSILDPVAFLATGVAGMTLSTIHLGRRLRAWRALLNIRTSWLSREVLAFLLFLILSACSFFVPSSVTLTLCAVVAGLATLVSVDMVYSIAENRSAPGLCSASVVLTGLLLFAAFSESWWLFVILSGMKFILYGYEFVSAVGRDPWRIAVAVVRIVAGFILPLLLWGSSAGRLPAGMFLLLGEVINRSEFYIDLEFLTPQRQIQNDLLNELG